MKNSVTYLRNPVFQQDNATLTCDSAVFYNKRNYFEAYRNVHINQLTTDIYSNELQYDGNKKQAHLTGNVRMTDPTSVLTTEILDYNTVSKIGTYTSGGKIVNQQVTLTSKNGYYFSGSNDAYFRYNVVVVTPQVTIKSDTLRYNTQSKWTYFYGPTNIKGKDDNLYTENGAYNTATEDAYFGKKNLYTQGTRSLKGDSLYYFGKIGYGKAVKNIVFSDTKDKMKMFGDLGYYYKIDQRTLVSRNAYLGIGTEDSVLVKGKKRPDSLWMGADTLETQMVLQKNLKLVPKISIKADNEVGEDDEEEGAKDGAESPGKTSTETTEDNPKGKRNLTARNDKGAKIKPKNDRKNNDPTSPLDKLPTDSTKIDSLAKKLPKLSTDSLKDGNILKAKADSIVRNLPKIKEDSLAQKAIKTGKLIGKDAAGKVDSLTKAVGKTDIKNLGKGVISALKPGLAKNDTTKFNPADTVQARIIKAYHGVKIFKSNIQAKTDSLFYTSADSTLRCFVNPIIWSEGSQQIADTIYVQFKNKKLNNLQAIRNAFLVNTPKDSLRFNQIKGRLMTGFFNNGKLKTMYVDGNAESIYYTQDDSTKVYKEMNQTLSSRIKFVFQDNENDIEDIVYIKGVEGALNPETKISKDNVLKGFSWKPKERPKSKKDAIGSSGKAKPKTKSKVTAPAKPKVAGKAVTKASSLPVKKVKKINLNINKNLPAGNLLDTVNFGIKPILPKADSLKKAIQKL
ncbi:OstA-like protein [Pedobacter sp. N23S346]|uniref:OstA-like protein n=1 Tax=Pedobacter sp. N23S346 TaxID=3402750 RepID=UPI003AD4A747